MLDLYGLGERLKRSIGGGKVSGGNESHSGSDSHCDQCGDRIEPILFAEGNPSLKWNSTRSAKLLSQPHRKKLGGCLRLFRWGIDHRRSRSHRRTQATVTACFRSRSGSFPPVDLQHQNRRFRTSPRSPVTDRRILNLPLPYGNDHSSDALTLTSTPSGQLRTGC